MYTVIIRVVIAATFELLDLNVTPPYRAVSLLCLVKLFQTGGEASE